MTIIQVGTKLSQSAKVCLIVACFGLTIATPLIWRYFPGYISGYLIQIPALLFAYGYTRRFRLLDRYVNWEARALLLLSFTLPLQNTFILKAARKFLLSEHLALEVFRPMIIVLILVLITSTLKQRCRPVIHPLILASAITGGAGWLLASVTSSNPSLSFANGFFEYACPFIILYCTLASTPDRSFLMHCIRLFASGFILVAVSQTISFYTVLCCGNTLGIPLFVDEFLKIKTGPLVISAGDNGYGNTDNFISLWILVLPLIVSCYYLDKSRIWITPFFGLLYAGLLVYSRAGLITIMLSLTTLSLCRIASHRKFSFLPIAAVTIIIIIHASPGGMRHVANGINSFINSSEYREKSDTSFQISAPRENNHQPIQAPNSNSKTTNIAYDISGADRMLAMKHGLEIGSRNWKTGIGFGVYAIAEPSLTAPHNMLLLRFAEGGILSAISLLLMAIYAPWRMVQLMFAKSTDLLALTCSIALSGFMLKAFIFGATFSIGGQIAWGLGVALMFAVLEFTSANCSR